MAYMTPALELAVYGFVRDYLTDAPPHPYLLRIVQTVVGITHCIHSHFAQVMRE